MIPHPPRLLRLPLLAKATTRSAPSLRGVPSRFVPFRQSRPQPGRPRAPGVVLDRVTPGVRTRSRPPSNPKGTADLSLEGPAGFFGHLGFKAPVIAEQNDLDHNLPQSCWVCRSLSSSNPYKAFSTGKAFLLLVHSSSSAESHKRKTCSVSFTPLSSSLPAGCILPGSFLFLGVGEPADVFFRDLWSLLE